LLLKVFGAVGADWCGAQAQFTMRVGFDITRTFLPFIVAALSPEAALLATGRRRQERERRRRAANRHRERAAKLAEMDAFTDSEFKQQYRMSRPAFNALLDLIEPTIYRNEEMARRSSGSVRQNHC